jgi:hypothetical protein
MEVFQVKAKVRRQLRNCKRRIQHRLRKRQWPEQHRRLFRDRNVHYELGDKTQGLHCGGLGAIHLLVRQLGLADAIDRALHLLKRHLPYFESDHVLNLMRQTTSAIKATTDENSNARVYCCSAVAANS